LRTTSQSRVDREAGTPALADGALPLEEVGTIDAVAVTAQSPGLVSDGALHDPDILSMIVAGAIRHRKQTLAVAVQVSDLPLLAGLAFDLPLDFERPGIILGGSGQLATSTSGAPKRANPRREIGGQYLG
jgi:hypothetical protein